MLRHAFIMSVHTNLEQLQILVTALQFGDVYIHVDKKQDALFKQLKEIYKNDSNVFLVEDRVSVNWSGFSQVQATIKLFELVESTKRTYDYIHFISGQDLPLMSHAQMDAYIENKGTDQQFVEVHNIDSYKWRLTQYSFFRENPNNRKKLYRLTDIALRLIQMPFVHRNNFKGFELYKGSQWFSITYECMNYILSYIHENDYCSKFEYTACPDEHFFQVLLMNSKYKDNVLKYNSRYIVFEGLNASPKTLGVDDMDSFMNGQYMFARKFDMNKDKKVISKILDRG